MNRQLLKKIYRKSPRILMIPLMMIWGWGKYLDYPKFFSDYCKFKKSAAGKDKRFTIKLSDFIPILGEDTVNTDFDRHYIYHPAWATRIVTKIKPEFHVDISSALTFVTMLSATVPVRFYDYRPAKVKLDNLFCGQAELHKLPFADNEIKSLSCMHVVEHVGLGRYGDDIDPLGDLQAMSELKRVLAPGGDLLFVVPIGQPKIMFNAHRVYGYDQIIDGFEGLTLHEFALIPRSDDGDLLINPDRKIIESQDYGCGCFWFKKV